MDKLVIDVKVVSIINLHNIIISIRIINANISLIS